MKDVATALGNRLGRARAALSGPAVWTDLVVVVALVVVNSSVVAFLDSEPEWTHYTGNRAASMLAGVPVAAVLLARRSFPITVLVVLPLAGIAADTAHLFVWGAAGPGMTAAAYSVGRYHPLMRSLSGVLVGMGADIVSTALVPTPEDTRWYMYVMYLSLLAAGWWIGRMMRRRAFDVAELRARARRLEGAREAHARARLAEERSRIARELHDVVAHHVSVMTVQATAGGRVLERDPERARQVFRDIEQTGRQAMSEMRRIVGVLRTGADEDAGRAPQPGLADLSELLRQTADTGIGVALRTEGHAVALAPSLDLTLYRVVQESLTNVLKHAGAGASAEVAVRFSERSVEVRVTDDGPGAGWAPGPETEPGQGLLGMRERVSLFGGELRVGPRADGGFAVCARVPLETVPGGG